MSELLKLLAVIALIWGATHDHHRQPMQREERQAAPTANEAPIVTQSLLAARLATNRDVTVAEIEASVAEHAHGDRDVFLAVIGILKNSDHIPYLREAWRSGAPTDELQQLTHYWDWCDPVNYVLIDGHRDAWMSLFHDMVENTIRSRSGVRAALRADAVRLLRLLARHAEDAQSRAFLAGFEPNELTADELAALTAATRWRGDRDAERRYATALWSHARSADLEQLQTLSVASRSPVLIPLLIDRLETASEWEAESLSKCLAAVTLRYDLAHPDEWRQWLAEHKTLVEQNDRSALLRDALCGADGERRLREAFTARIGIVSDPDLARVVLECRNAPYEAMVLWIAEINYVSAFEGERQRLLREALNNEAAQTLDTDDLRMLRRLAEVQQVAWDEYIRDRIAWEERNASLIRY